MSLLVVDCSATMAWFFGDERTSAATSVLAQVARDGAMMPAIWPIEVANVLALAERKGRTAPHDADQFLTELAALPITIEVVSLGEITRQCLLLARSHRLTTYDAMYLELAKRKSLPLCSKDRPLLQAAAAEGITAIDVSQ